MLVTIDFPPLFGGVANYWAQLCRQMASADIVVLAPECDDSLDFDIKQNFLIYRKVLLSKSKWLWPKWLALLYWTWRLARQERIEKIIVTHILPVGTVALILKMVLRLPYIVSVHGLDIALPLASKIKTWLVKKILCQADAVIANSDFTRNELLKFGCGQGNEVEVIYPCPNVRNEKILPEDVNEWREKYQLKEKRIILTAGRLIERKGHDKMIEALPQILEKAPNAVYLIVGSGANEGYLKELAQGLAVENHILFFPDIIDSEMLIFYNLADVFVMPCRCLENGDVEGFGIVYLEANSFGKPVIAGRTGGAPEAVEHGVNGLLVDPLDVNKIARAVVSLLSDEQQASELGERGRRRVAEKFNWEEQGRKLIKIVNGL